MVRRAIASFLAACAACSSSPSSSSTPPSVTPPSVCDEPPAAPPPSVPAQSVLEHHGGPTRAGVYVDATLTRAAAAGFHRDPAFAATVQGSLYAQPLFLHNGPGGRDALIVATEQNQVYALDADCGAVLWQRSLGAPVARASLPCGDIDPLGVTGTPVIDEASRTLYLDAMTTPDGGATKRHRVFALSVDDGSVRPGWPVDVQGLAFGGATFDSTVQNQRGALALAGGRVYIPYGGHAGDCAQYRGWLVGISTANPGDAVAWATGATGGGSWGPSGVVSDGTSVFIATGNTIGASVWSGGEALLRFGSGPVFSEATADFFVPTDWLALDAADLDLGGTGPLLFDLPGATPERLAVALGKDGKLYVLDRTALGGIGGELSSTQVAQGAIVNAAAVWVGAAGAQVVFRGVGNGCPAGQSGDLTAVRIPASTSPAASVLWCARQNGGGSPMVTTTDGQAEAIVWSVGAGGDGRLHGFDGETGAVVYAGGGAAEAMMVRPFQTPILAGGRIFVGGDGAVYAFKR